MAAKGRERLRRSGTRRTSPSSSAFLATDEAADVNGQVFVVFGGNIWAMGGFHPVGEVHRDHAWTPEELVAAKGELFKGIDSGIPKFSFF